MSFNSRHAIMSIALVAISFACAQAELPVIRESEQDDTAGVKQPFTVKRADCNLTMGGKARIEQFFQPNINMLNKSIPDEAEYFKETVDLTFDVAYGKQKYGHTAAEFFLDLRHKGIWGKATSYADKDSSPVGPASVSLSESVFGAHSHVSGKPLIWYKDAWLMFTWNAVFDCENEKLHSLKLGWFPFELGRGIALGSAYGVNKEGFGLYSYQEDKGAPGILAHGELIKDALSYDLYFSRFEERCKGMGDSISMVKKHWVDRAKSGAIWRGVGKQDDVYAARMQWKPYNKHESVGTMQVEPYIFYNDASDQGVDIAPDAHTKWGSYGLMFEHAVNGFEYGAEVAFNYGTEYLHNIDRNQTEIVRDANGFLVERYTNIFTDNQGKVPALITGSLKPAPGTGSMGAAHNYRIAQNTTQAAAQIGTTAFHDGPSKGKSRFRPAYKNSLHGWMGVADVAYTFKDLDLKFALSYGYVSGDGDPHREEKSKRYNGFIGLHEWYSGSRVYSMMLLDDASILRPTSLEVAGESKPTGASDYSFADLQLVGIGATWKPKGFAREFSINPNVLGYWKTNRSYGYDAVAKTATQDHARMYLGTEFNVATKCSLMKDLTFFGNAGVFNPGGFYADIKGIPLSSDKFKRIEEDPRNAITDASEFRISTDLAYHLNCGVEFKF